MPVRAGQFLQRAVWLLAAACLASAALGARAAEDLAARTVVLVNSRQADSVALGEFYLAQRGIPRTNLVALPMPTAESITWREFVDQVWQPLQDELHRRGWLEGSLSEQLDAFGRRKSALLGHRLAFLVVCRGTPLRINDDPTALDPAVTSRVPDQFRHNQAAVDSELALLAQNPTNPLGFVPNPLFRAKQLVDFSAELVVKVARLDGPTDAEARALVTSALTAERQGLLGRAYVDLGGPHATGDRWFETVATKLAELGFSTDVDRKPTTFDVADRFDTPALYFGWYSGGVGGPFVREGFRFPAGAIALHLHSYSAATVRSDRDHWVGPLVARGAAATFGNVFEPYLEFTIRPDLLLEKLAAGATLGDATFYATPVLSWQAIVIGDPLYRPFKVSLEEQLKHLADLPVSLAGSALARQAAVLDHLEMYDEERALFARGMRDFPSLALALEQARFELARGQPKAAVAALGFVPALRNLTPADWPLVRQAGEFVAAHGSAKDALPIYRLLGDSKAPSVPAQIAALQDARKLADATGNLVLSLEIAKRITDLTPPPTPLPPPPAKK